MFFLECNILVQIPVYLKVQVSVMKCGIQRIKQKLLVHPVFTESSMYMNHALFASTAIDPDGVLCQARDPQGWHGTRSNKSVVGQGQSMISLKCL